LSRRPRIVVVGAGISGLTAAYRLRDTCEVTVLESSNRIGGHIRTEEHGGLLLEWGPDSLVAHKPAGERLCRELGLGDRLLRLRSGGSRMQVMFDDGLHQVPEGFLMISPTRLMPLLTTPMLSLGGKLRAGLERFIPARREDADETLQSFVTRRWGRQLYERVAEPVLGGLFSGNARRLSARACIPRMCGMEREHGSIAAGLSKMKSAHGAAQRPQAGVYGLAGGMGTLIQALAEPLPQDALRLRTPVRALEPTTVGWRVVLDDGETIDSDGVVLACPAYVASRLLAKADPGLADQLNAVEFATCVTVNLLYDVSAVGKELQGFGFFVARSAGSPLLACNYTSSKFEGRAPRGCVMLRAFLGGAGRESLDHVEDGQLVHIAHEALAPLLDLRGAPRFGRARRVVDALPQPVVGIETIRERLAEGLPNLALCGSACGLVGLPDCIDSADKAVRQLTTCIARSEGAERAG